MNFKSIDIQVLDSSGEIIIQNGILVEGDKVCAIYDLDEWVFKFICTTRFELNIELATQGPLHKRFGRRQAFMLRIWRAQARRILLRIGWDTVLQ